jgi:DNA primase catalytic core
MRQNNNDLEQIKQQVPILELIQSYGIETKKQGKDYAALCPFHDDKNPSLIISPDKNLWNCLGCTGSKTGGDAIEFVMKYERLNFAEAVQKLQEKYPLGNAEIPAFAGMTGSPSSVQPTTHHLPPELLERVSAIYHKTFTADPRGRNYLASRGITNKAIYEQFQLGYSNGKLLDIIPKEGEIIEQLKELGILNDQGKEFFYGCVVVPILDRSGRVVHLYGRKINQNGGTHYYLKGGHKGIFNAWCLRSYNEVILTESIIDAMSVYQAGCKNVIPLYGINGLTQDHINLLKEYQTKKILLLLDADEQGRKAARTIKDTLESSLDAVASIAELPDNEDANSYLLKKGEDKLREKITLGSEVFSLQPTTHHLQPVVQPTTHNLQPTTCNEDGFTAEYCKRRYIIRGIEGSRNRLKVNIKCEKLDSLDKRFHIDTVDLYLARSRKGFIKGAQSLFHEEEEIIERDVTKLIYEVENYVKQQTADRSQVTAKELTAQELEQAKAFGQRQDLIPQILKDIEQCGFIGEEMNKLVCYLAMTSRKMEDPLSVLIISGSGAGKSTLQDCILSLCPEEELIKLTSITGKALFYKQEQSLANKVLAVEEEKGAEDASYAIRNLISAKTLSIEATIKDQYTGKMTTMENKVQGPTAVFKTTTDPDTDPETKNRFFVLSVDESREQTQRILKHQRKMHTLEGILGKSKIADIIKKHKNFQRSLKQLKIINPYAEVLSYLDDRIQVRRDHPKYLNLIETVAFLRQYQKEIKNHHNMEYIEVDLEDIKTANEIAHYVLGRSLDELSEPSRRLLELIQRMVREISQREAIPESKVQISRRMIREYTKWSDYQIRTHLDQLVSLEYLRPVSGRNGQQYKYVLCYTGSVNKESSLTGLMDVDKLKGKGQGKQEKKFITRVALSYPQPCEPRETLREACETLR